MADNLLQQVGQAATGQGPFSEMLTAPIVRRGKPSGWEGAAGTIGYLASEFLGGAHQARLTELARQERERSENLLYYLNYAQNAAASDKLTPAGRDLARETWSKTLAGSLSDVKDQPAAQQDGGLFANIGRALKGTLIHMSGGPMKLPRKFNALEEVGKLQKTLESPLYDYATVSRNLAQDATAAVTNVLQRVPRERQGEQANEQDVISDPGVQRALAAYESERIAVPPSIQLMLKGQMSPQEAIQMRGYRERQEAVMGKEGPGQAPPLVQPAGAPVPTVAAPTAPAAAGAAPPAQPAVPAPEPSPVAPPPGTPDLAESRRFLTLWGQPEETTPPPAPLIAAPVPAAATLAAPAAAAPAPTPTAPAPAGGKPIGTQMPADVRNWLYNNELVSKPQKMSIGGQNVIVSQVLSGAWEGWYDQNWKKVEIEPPVTETAPTPFLASLTPGGRKQWLIQGRRGGQEAEPLLLHGKPVWGDDPLDRQQAAQRQYAERAIATALGSAVNAANRIRAATAAAERKANDPATFATPAQKADQIRLARQQQEQQISELERGLTDQINVLGANYGVGEIADRTLARWKELRPPPPAMTAPLTSEEVGKVLGKRKRQERTLK